MSTRRNLCWRLANTVRPKQILLEWLDTLIESDITNDRNNDAPPPPTPLLKAKAVATLENRRVATLLNTTVNNLKDDQPTCLKSCMTSLRSTPG